MLTPDEQSILNLFNLLIVVSALIGGTVAYIIIKKLKKIRDNKRTEEVKSIAPLVGLTYYTKLTDLIEGTGLGKIEQPQFMSSKVHTAPKWLRLMAFIRPNAKFENFLGNEKMIITDYSCTGLEHKMLTSLNVIFSTEHNYNPEIHQPSQTAIIYKLEKPAKHFVMQDRFAFEKLILEDDTNINSKEKFDQLWFLYSPDNDSNFKKTFCQTAVTFFEQNKPFNIIESNGEYLLCLTTGQLLNKKNFEQKIKDAKKVAEIILND
jgi:hypothetical protein